MESTTNANQKEKFEGDLKKEIKKLQVIQYTALLCYICADAYSGLHKALSP